MQRWSRTIESETDDEWGERVRYKNTNKSSVPEAAVIGLTCAEALSISLPSPCDDVSSPIGVSRMH